MFNSMHYVPILKWKPAEQAAISYLDEIRKSAMTPLIQIVMPNPKAPKKGEPEKTQEEQLEEVTKRFIEESPLIAVQISELWGKTPIFIDFNLVYTDDLRKHGLTTAMSVGNGLGLSLIPVVNFSSSDEIKKITSSLAKKYGKGLCLRLVFSDFDDLDKLEQVLKEFIENSSLSEDQIDLLVDLKDRNDEYAYIAGLCQNISSINKWRTFILASGAFPVDLSDYELGENYRTRFDWNSWLALINSEMKRLPAFSDYTILHPIYKEAARFFTPSASIRYTIDGKWLIMRGQKGKSDQYLANAQLLSQDQKFKEIFSGEKFCYGDSFIVEKGMDLKSKKTGNAANWLTAGVNHHLSYVADQISNLNDDTNNAESLPLASPNPTQ